MTKKKAAKKTKTARRTKVKSRKVAESGRHDQLLALLRAPQGASLEAIQKAFGWQAHSVRGAISILGKKHRIESAKVDGARVYRIAG
jgi:predicted transcriptional regulator